MKYKVLRDESVDYFGITLYRVKRLSDGLVGGFIESEANLSQEGSCFVYNDAKVSGSARVFESAEVSGLARVSGSAEVSGSAKVSGSAWVSGSAEVFESARVFESVTLRDFDEVKSSLDYVVLTFNPYVITVTRCGVNIGCKSFSFDELEALTEHEDYTNSSFERQKALIWMALDEILDND